MQLTAPHAATAILAARPATSAQPLEARLGAAADSFATTLRQGETTAMEAMTAGADPHALCRR